MSDEDRRTLWCGNLPEKATEELLYELFLQAGPLEKVKIPKDRDGRQRNFGFITFIQEVSVQYAMELFRGTEFFQRNLSLQFRGGQGPKHTSFKGDVPPLRDLPPPIHPDVQNKFEEMTNQLAINNPLQNMQYDMVYNVTDQRDNRNDRIDQRDKRQERMSQLSMASLQGNWSTRHHPYQRDEFRDNKGHFNPKHRNEKHWDDNHHNANPRHKSQRRHFNDDHRGNYGRNRKGDKNNR